jgi:hypothetical protein
MGDPDPEEPPPKKPMGAKEKKEPTCCKSITGWWVSSMDRLREAVTYCVLFVAKYAALHPYSYAVGITLFSFIVLAIGLATNFNMVLDAKDVVTPTDSIVREQRSWIQHESGFPEWPRSLRVLIHKGGDNVLSNEGVLRAFEIVETINNVDGYVSLCEESMATNELGFSGECHQRGITLFWNNSRSVFDEEVSSTVDVILAASAEHYPDGSEVDPGEIMGRVSYHYSTIVSAQSFLMEILIPVTSESATAMSVEALKALMALRNEWHNDPSNPYEMQLYLTNFSAERESFRAVFSDAPLVPAVFVIMFLFTCLVFSTSYRPEEKKFKQRIFLGICAVVTILLSMVTSYGMLFIIGKIFL